MTAHELGGRDDIEVLGVVLVYKAPGGLSKALKGKLRVVQYAIGGANDAVVFSVCLKVLGNSLLWRDRRLPGRGMRAVGCGCCHDRN